MKKEISVELKRNLLAIFGNILCGAGINLFLVPFGLYTGGLYGICQLLRTLLNDIIMIPNVDIAGIIYFILNIPLFLMAYKKFNKSFIISTFISVTVLELCLTFIPTDLIIINDPLTSIIIGSVISGYGAGIALKVGSSGGGLDIIGLYLMKMKKNISVGKLSVYVNAFIYLICAIIFSLPVAIYSIVSAIIRSFVMDNTHSQTVPETALIVTKNKNLKDIIMNTFDRGTTIIEGSGGYTEKDKYVILCTLSKYETTLLYHLCYEEDKHVFITILKNDSVFGNFKNHLDYNETLFNK